MSTEALFQSYQAFASVSETLTLPATNALSLPMSMDARWSASKVSGVSRFALSSLLYRSESKRPSV